VSKLNQYNAASHCCASYAAQIPVVFPSSLCSRQARGEKSGFTTYICIYISYSSTPFSSSPSSSSSLPRVSYIYISLCIYVYIYTYVFFPTSNPFSSTSSCRRIRCNNIFMEDTTVAYYQCVRLWLMWHASWPSRAGHRM